jgi:hypothetical protein
MARIRLELSVAILAAIKRIFEVMQAAVVVGKE